MVFCVLAKGNVVFFLFIVIGIDYCSPCVHANGYLSVKARDSHSLRTGRHTTHEVVGETPVRPLTSIWNTWSPLTCMFGQVWTYFLRERPGIKLYLTLACRNSYSNVGKIYFQGNKVPTLYSTIEVMWRHMRLTCRFAYSSHTLWYRGNAALLLHWPGF